MKQVDAERLMVCLYDMTDVKGVAGVKLARNLRMLSEELKEYLLYKQEMFKKYGTEDENGQWKIQTNTENYFNYLKEMKSLDELEVTFDFRKINEEELANSGLTAEQILKIWEIIEC